jgi:uncharacterized membrane protein YsdA (DUF1294 family)
MSTRGALVVLGAVAAWNAITQAVYWIDRARADRARRRISGRTLLMAALAGSIGALDAVCAHRRRHKGREAELRRPALVHRRGPRRVRRRAGLAGVEACGLATAGMTACEDMITRPRGVRTRGPVALAAPPEATRTRAPRTRLPATRDTRTSRMEPSEAATMGQHARASSGLLATSPGIRFGPRRLPRRFHAVWAVAHVEPVVRVHQIDAHHCHCALPGRS